MKKTTSCFLRFFSILISAFMMCFNIGAANADVADALCVLNQNAVTPQDVFYNLNRMLTEDKQGYYIDAHYTLPVECGISNQQGLVAICPPGWIVARQNEPCQPLSAVLETFRFPSKESYSQIDYSMYDDYYSAGWHVVPYGTTSFSVLSCLKRLNLVPTFYDADGKGHFAYGFADLRDYVYDWADLNRAYSSNNCSLEYGPLLEQCPIGTTIDMYSDHASNKECVLPKRQVRTWLTNNTIQHGGTEVPYGGLTCYHDVSDNGDYVCDNLTGNVQVRIPAGAPLNMMQELVNQSNGVLDPYANKANDGKCAIYTPQLEHDVADPSNPSLYQRILCVPGGILDACGTLQHNFPNQVDVLSSVPQDPRIGTRPQEDYYAVYNASLTAALCDGDMFSIPTYEIRFDGNDKAAVVQCEPVNYYVDEKNNCTTVSCSSAARRGHELLGWCDGKGKNCGSSVNVCYDGNQSIMLYAQWQPKTYTISYELDGGTGSPKGMPSTYTYDEGQGVSIDGMPTKTGYVFSGWCTDPELTDCDKTGSINPGTTGDITLYANWTEEATTVTCSAGTYLRGSDGTCQTCPANSYCAGGTFTPNGSDQGKNSCPSGYPNSTAGSSLITQCYSNTKSRAWSGSQTLCTKPTGCSAVTCNTCSNPACTYVAYSNSTGNGDGTIKNGCSTNNAPCQQTVQSVTAAANYYSNVSSCPSCSDGTNGNYPYSAAGISNKGACYLTTTPGKYVATAGAGETTCAPNEYCPGGTQIYYDDGGVGRATTGGYGKCDADTNGAYPNSVAGSDGINDCSKPCSVECSGNDTSACPAHATCTYNPNGNVKTGTQFYGSNTCSATAGLCPVLNFVCDAGYNQSGNSCVSPSSITCQAGKYLRGSDGTCQTCPTGSYCAGGTFTPNGSDQGKISCSVGTGGNYTQSAAGISDKGACYLTITPGKYVATAGAGEVDCATGGYCTGGMQIYYDAGAVGRTTTGGWDDCAHAADGMYPYSAEGNDAVEHCYLTTTPGKYVATAGAGEVDCAPGGYCPGSIQVSFDGIGGNNTCPIEYNNSAAGSTSIDDCYLETTPGAYVYMQGHGLDNCTNTSYCPGGVKVYYSGTSVDGHQVTGGATSCTSLGAFYTRSDGNRASASTCYGTTSAGHYLANAADATESTCAAGGYCQGSVTVHYGSTGGRTICNAGMYSSNGASSCSNVTAGYYNTGCGTNATGGVCGSYYAGGTIAPGYYGAAGATSSYGSGQVTAGYYSTGGGTSATPTSAGNGCISSKSCGTISAGYYGATGAYSPQGSGQVTAGYYSTGGGTSATPTAAGNGCISSKSCGPISAGYYGAAGATKATGSGAVYKGYYSTGGGTAYKPESDGTGCISGYSCGKIDALYYSTGGATSATPTAEGNGCISGKTCGMCPENYRANTTTGKGAISSCSISCAAGTVIETPNASSCTTPEGNWIRGAHSVGYGSVSGLFYCMDGFTISGILPADHDSYGDCSQTLAGYSIPALTRDVRYIRVTTTGNTVDNTGQMVEISAYASTTSGEPNLLLGKSGPVGQNLTNATDGSTSVANYASGNTMVWDMESVQAVRYIDFLLHTDGRTYHDVNISVSTDNSNWTTVLSIDNIKTTSNHASRLYLTGVPTVCPDDTYKTSYTAKLSTTYTCSSCPSGYSTTGTTAADHDQQSDCEISCAAGTRVASSTANCTTSATNWYTSAHKVKYGSVSSVSHCQTGYATPNTTTATDHDNANDCKITCEAGQYVSSINGTCSSVDDGYFRSSSETISQGSTGTRTACTSLGAFYTRSDDNRASASTCYGTTSAGNYLANPEGATESTCAAGGYCQGSVTVHYGSTGGRTICDAGKYSSNGASSCSNVTAGYYNTGCGTNATGGVCGSPYAGGTIAAGYYGASGATSSQGSGKVNAGYYSTGGGTSATPTSAGNGCISSKSCGTISAGYYGASGATTSQGSGKVNAGYYSTGGGTSATPTAAGNGCISSKSCGTISAGYYGAAGATTATGAGAVSAGYYSTGGGTSATPIAAGNGCISSKSCGKVNAGYLNTGCGTNATGGVCSSSYSGGLRTYYIYYNDISGNIPGLSPETYTVETNTFWLPEPSRTGYTFYDWYTDPSLTHGANRQITKGSTGDIYVYANWTKKITYDEDNGQPDWADGCQIADTFTLPPAPQKSGFTFAGWVVQQTAFDQCPINTIQGINTSASIDSYGFISLDSQGKERGFEYDLTEPGEWAIDLHNTGIIRGKAMCSSTNGTLGAVGNPSSGQGKNCWCQMTSFEAPHNDRCIASSGWILVENNKPASYNECAGNCSVWCANRMSDNTLLTSLINSVNVATNINQCSASTIQGLDSSIQGAGDGNIELDGRHDNNVQTYQLTTPGEWAVELADNSIIHGQSKCSVTNSGELALGNPSNTGGQYCWCQMTTYTPNGGGMCSAPSGWSQITDLYSQSNCESGCASVCSGRFAGDRGMRDVLYGSISGSSGPAQCSASTISSSDVQNDGSDYASIVIANGGVDGTPSTYGISQPGEWGTTLASGSKVKGLAKCSSLQGDNGYGSYNIDARHWTATDNDMTSAGNGNYCWCQITGVTPNGGNMCTTPSTWIYDYEFPGGDCGNECSRYCAKDLMLESNRRGAVESVLGL